MMMPNNILKVNITDVEPLRGPTYRGVIIYAECSKGGGGVVYVTRGDVELRYPLVETTYELLYDKGGSYEVISKLVDSNDLIYYPYFKGNYTVTSIEKETVPSVCNIF